MKDDSFTSGCIISSAKTVMRIFPFLFFVFISTSPFYVDETEALVPSKKVVFPNGFEAVFIENHSVPVVASVVTVKAGSANETLRTNGISHMLEHLLFNGTAKRTQKEIYEESDFYGIYNNAHTGKNFTNFIVLSERENGRRALELQADMILNSTIPEDKFKKEKGVILNEIAKDIASASFSVEEQFNRHFFYGTPYNLPVIGVPESIKAIDRDEVLSYYKTYYVPNNASAIIMGDFDTGSMVKLLERLYGKTAPGKIPRPQDFELKEWRGAKKRSSTMAVKKTTITFGALIPSIKTRDFFRLNLAAMLFDSTFKSEFNKRLKAAIGVEASDAFAGVDFTGDFAIFRADISLATDVDSNVVENVFYGLLKDFASKPVDRDALEGVLTSSYVEEVKLLEKPHYYGMMKGKHMASGGWDFVRTFVQRLKEEKKSLGSSTLSYFKDLDFKVSVVRPGKLTYLDILPSIKKEYYDSANKTSTFTPESLAVVREWEKDFRSIKIKSYRGTGQQGGEGQKKVKRIILNNSLTVLINSDPFSEVFAVHLLAKDRSLKESRGGIAEFLHRLLKKGTESLSERELKLKLASIGATIKTHDNRFIPYDDHYTTNEHSYIRFETVDRFAESGARLLADIIKNPGFRANDIEEVRSEIISILEESEESPGKQSLLLFKGSLFKELPQGMPVNGTIESIKSISEEDLLKFHKRYFSPRNLILTISTSRPANEVVKYVKENFGSMINAPGPDDQVLTLQKTAEGSEIRVKMGKPQSYLRIGKIFNIDEGDRAALTVLGGLVAEKLAFRLREKLGLVYSLSFSFDFKGKYSILKGSFGTRPETLAEVEAEAMKVIQGFDPFSIKERDIKRVINLYISRNVMRRLARISQAYYHGLEEFMGLPPGETRARLSKMRDVSLSRVRLAARKYLSVKNLVKVSIE